LTGLDKAASRSSASSSSKNPATAASSSIRPDLARPEDRTLFFTGMTTAVEEPVVLEAETAVVDETVRVVDPAALGCLGFACATCKAKIAMTER
jgi:hypothetical protein